MAPTNTNHSKSDSCWKAVTQLPRIDGTNAGLLLSRYLPIWTELLNDIDNKDRNEAKRELLKSAISACTKTHKLYEQAFLRWKNHLGDALQKELYVRNRMIVGLGCDSVLETGITLHHTYGTPIIPGSALKGLASHYCHTVWGQENNESSHFSVEFQTLLQLILNACKGLLRTRE